MYTLSFLLKTHLAALVRHLYGRNHPLVWRTVARVAVYERKALPSHYPTYHALKEFGHVVIVFKNNRFDGWTWRLTLPASAIDYPTLHPFALRIQLYMRVNRYNHVVRLMAHEQMRHFNQFLAEVDVRDVFQNHRDVFSLLSKTPPCVLHQRSFANTFNVRDARTVDYCTHVFSGLRLHDTPSLPPPLRHRKLVTVPAGDTDTEDA